MPEYDGQLARPKQSWEMTGYLYFKGGFQLQGQHVSEKVLSPLAREFIREVKGASNQYYIAREEGYNQPYRK